MRRITARRRLRRRTIGRIAATLALALVATALPPVTAGAANMSELGALLDLTRPELADVAAELGAGDEAGAAEELKNYYASRMGIEYPHPSGAGLGDATADELAAGVFRFGTETRDFYNEDEQRIDVDWTDTWGGTEEAPGSARVRMVEFVFMPTLASAYLAVADPAKRAAYAKAWMEISLDFFADNPTWPRDRNLPAAKRLDQLISTFSVFRTEPTLDASDLVDYLSGVHATADRLAIELQAHRGNNWYASMARAIYVMAVYLPEFAKSDEWEHFAIRSLDWFLSHRSSHIKSDTVFREPTVNYLAYAADLANKVIEVGELNGRSLPSSITRTADWLADVLFALRMPNLETPLVGDAPSADAGEAAIRTSGERNSWSDFTWVGSGRKEGTEPQLGSTIYPISFAVQRSGWDPDARYLMINNQNTGYTASHRHPDDLSLVMAAYGRPLIVDPGSADYSDTRISNWMRRTTEAHNTVEVDGQPQEAGVTRASYVWRSNDGLDVYRGEAHGYRPVIHDRVVYFVKPGFWIVSDSLTGDTANHDYRQLWHFPGDPVAVDPDTNVATVGFDTVPGAAPVAGVQLVPVPASDAELTASVHHDGAARVGDEVLTDIDYLSYTWSTAGRTGLDTLVVPGKAGPAPSVTATRIELPGVDHSVATAMEIDLPKATGQFYLSREETPARREFGSAETDAETAYLERSEKGELRRYALTRGASLMDGDETLVDASGVVSDISVALRGATAHVSLGDPFDGSLSIFAPKAKVVLVNGAPTEFTRSGDMVTVSVETPFSPTPVLDEEFDESGLDRTAYDFDDGTLQGWAPLPGHGTWELGVDDGGQLAQTSLADGRAFAVQHDVPADVRVSAHIVPGARDYATARTGLAFRYQDSRHHYRANVLKTREGVMLQLVKVFNGELTVLAETPLSIGPDEPHTLTVSAVGRHLTAAVGDTSVAAEDDQLVVGGIAAFTHRQRALFDDIAVAEVLDEEHWRGISGDASIVSGRLRLAPTDDRAHVLLDSSLPARFSETCDYDVAATVTLLDVGAAGISLRDTTDSYGYRLHVGKTSRNTRYASIAREAHRSGPVTVATTSLDNPLTDSVRVKATIHGDRITMTLNGEQILETRDTLVRSGAVGLHATAESTFDDVKVASSCGP